MPDTPTKVTPSEPPDNPGVREPDDTDVREEVRRVQEGHKDAGPSAGVVTEELSEATRPE